MILREGVHLVAALQLQRANREEYDSIPKGNKVAQRKKISEYWNIRHAIEDYIYHMSPLTGERDDQG